MNSNEKTTLLPCPFCGGPVALEKAHQQNHEHFGRRQFWGVKCHNTINLGGTCAIEQVPSASPEAAITRWNRRAALPPPIVEPVKMTQELYNLLFSWATYNIKRGYSMGAKARVESELLAHIGTLTTPVSAPSDGAADARDAARYRAIRSLMESAKGSASIEVNQHLAYYETCEPGEEVRLQWYPDTPIGFYVIEAATFDEMADAAIASTHTTTGGET